MAHTFKVTIGAGLSDKEVEKVSKALHRATAKWFRQGYDVKVEAQ